MTKEHIIISIIIPMLCALIIGIVNPVVTYILKQIEINPHKKKQSSYIGNFLILSIRYILFVVLFIYCFVFLSLDKIFVLNVLFIFFGLIFNVIMDFNFVTKNRSIKLIENLKEVTDSLIIVSNTVKRIIDNQVNTQESVKEINKTLDDNIKKLETHNDLLLKFKNSKYKGKK